ncbi:energy transducer TonB [Hippea alviniae]|uniref:energy transducer TonB n=1 Tax=Hippea alviniae TaxID=1279027 RepID=UPI00041FB53A|nr:energy transducer TonB [Hippea alviniae]
MSKFKRFLWIGFFISLLLHLSLFLLFVDLFKIETPQKPKEKKPIIVDIITLPKQKEKPKIKEKHKIAANISRKGSSKIYSKEEKLPFGSNKPKTIGTKPSKQKEKTVSKKRVKPSLTGKTKAEVKREKKPSLVKIKGGLFKTIPKSGFTAGKSKEYKSKNVKREATVSIGTQSIKYASYMQHIKHKIQNVWIYPQEAIQTGQQGRLLILFSIGKDGSLVKLKLLRSSGYPLLDKAALQAVKDAAPFPPLPKRFGVDVLNIYATFEYTLGYYFIY